METQWFSFASIRKLAEFFFGWKRDGMGSGRGANSQKKKCFYSSGRWRIHWETISMKRHLFEWAELTDASHWQHEWTEKGEKMEERKDSGAWEKARGEKPRKATGDN